MEQCRAASCQGLENGRKLRSATKKVDEKYFLSMSVGGVDMGREEAMNPELGKVTEVAICAGHSQDEYCQPGFIRNLVVLEK